MAAERRCPAHVDRRLTRRCPEVMAESKFAAAGFETRSTPGFLKKITPKILGLEVAND
jgi:hypothetical protein